MIHSSRRLCGRVPNVSTVILVKVIVSSLQEWRTSQLLVPASMAATPNGLVHEDITSSTSTAVVDLSPYSTAEQTRITPTQTDNQTYPKRGLSADFIQDFQP